MKITPRRMFALLLALVLLLSLCACTQKTQTEPDEPKINTAHKKNSGKPTGGSCITERRERFCITGYDRRHAAGAMRVFTGGRDIAWMVARQD